MTLKERILKCGTSSKGYNQVMILKKGKPKTFKVHRLVAQAFIPNPEDKLEINHIDCNKKKQSSR